MASSPVLCNCHGVIYLDCPNRRQPDDQPAAVSSWGSSGYLKVLPKDLRAQEDEAREKFYKSIQAPAINAAYDRVLDLIRAEQGIATRTKLSLVRRIEALKEEP